MDKEYTVDQVFNECALGGPYPIQGTGIVTDTVNPETGEISKDVSIQHAGWVLKAGHPAWDVANVVSRHQRPDGLLAVILGWR